MSSPRGNPSGWCAAVSNNGVRLVLKRCNANSAAQLFSGQRPRPVRRVHLDAASSGRAITNPTGAAYARAVLAPDTDSPGQSLTFEQSKAPTPGAGPCSDRPGPGSPAREGWS